MMNTRNFVTFEADFPDESQWAEDGSPLVPDGQSVARVLVQALVNAGLTVSELSQHSFYGWAWEANLRKRKAWCLLQGGDPWLLIVEQRGGMLERLLRGEESAELEEVLTVVDEAMKGDTRFSAVQWFTRQEYESGAGQGAESPF
jgi:hypothetical protein